MKRVAWILVLTLLITFLPTVSFAEASEEAQYYICRNFEAEIGTIRTAGATAEHVRQDGVGGSRGALKITVNADTGAILFPVQLEREQVYRMQVWVNPQTDILNDMVHFIFQSPFIGESISGYTDIPVTNTGLRKGVWTLVEADMRFDGKGIKAGTGGQRFDVTGNGTMEIRLGNGKLADTAADGKSLSFCIDDLMVFPLKDSGNLAIDGDFDTKGSLTSWRTLGAETKIIAGNKGGAIDVSVTRDYGEIDQIVPIQFGKTYQISFWAKTDNEQWNGKNLQVILDRYDRKTDTNVPNYEYLQDSDNKTITNQWKQYNITYRNDLTTDDTVIPRLYFRVGDGKERVRYQIDQMEIVEVDAAAQGNTIQAQLTDMAAVDQVLSAHISFQTGVGSKYAYRIFNRKQNDKWVMCDSGITEFDTISYTCRDADLGKEIRFEVTGIDSNGRYSNTINLLSAAVGEADDIQVLFNPSIWTDETLELYANIFVENRTERKELIALLALYDDSGNLVDCRQETRVIAQGQNLSWNICVDNIQEASIGKVFVWDKETQEPDNAVTTLKRVAGGQFVYLDAENGSDNAAGTAEEPLKTLPEAQKMVRQLLESTTEDIYLVLKSGEYQLSDTLKLSNQDSGGNRKVIYTSDGGKAKISGGQHLENNFTLYDSDKNIYRTFVGTGVQSRQLFVNGVRATRARSEGALKSAINKKDNSTLTTTDTSLLNYRKISDLELVFQEYWTNSRCGVESVSEGRGGILNLEKVAVLTMKQPGWTNLNNRGATSVTVPAYYENALELLDEEGEWYLDSDEGYLYYKPRYFEDIQTADFVLPILEKLITIEGTDKRNPIAGIEFHNLEFAYTTWMRPSTNNGLCDAQNNHLRDEDDRLPEAAIEVTYAHNIVFQDCTFDRLGVTALKMTKSIQNCQVVGNEFYDISGSAVSLGDPMGSYDSVVNPVDPKVWIRNNTISDNYIHRVGVDYQSAAAISVGFPKDTCVVRNEIYDAPYCGMHIGYGWAVHEEKGTATENLHIMNNYIHNVLNDKIYDGGGIYTIGATGGTMEKPNLIRGNYLKEIRNYHGALYPDEGSMYWKFTENVIDLTDTPYWYGKGNEKGNSRWLHVHVPTIKNNQYVNNFSTTAEKNYEGANSIFEEPHVYPDANWSTEALEIIVQAGISEAFQGNFHYGLQKVAAENSGAVTVGKSAQLRLNAIGSKEMAYDLSGAEIYTRSRNPKIAAVDGLTVIGVSAGTAVIDIAVIEQGMCRSLTVEVNVQK